MSKASEAAWRERQTSKFASAQDRIVTLEARNARLRAALLSATEKLLVAAGALQEIKDGADPQLARPRAAGALSILEET